MDLQVIETGNGGDLKLSGSDMAKVYSFENMPYLALFGGNKAAVTRQRLANEQAFDFWANALLWPNDPSVQMNSYTERALDDTPLTSAGRLIIEEAIKKDLEFMRPFAIIRVETEIIATDHLRIGIGIREPGNLQEREFIWIWEAGKLTLLNDDYVFPPVLIPGDEFLQYELQFYL